MNKLNYFLFIVIFSTVFVSVMPASIWKLFGGTDGSNGYQQYGNYGPYQQPYYGQSRPRYNYGRSHNEGGGNRYKTICRVHAAGTEGFPAVGNPVCPY